MKEVIKAEGVAKSFKAYNTKGTGLFSSVFRNYYTKKALQNVSFSINEGEMVALLGKNGSGKSTLIKIITGILHANTGVVRVMGMDPWKQRKELATRLGVVLGAHHQLYMDLPPIDTFELMHRMHNIPDAKFQSRLRYFIKMLNLEDVYKRPVRTLSFGERMKCNFVASVLHNPLIVLLDEPTIGVDLPSRVLLRNMIRHMQKKWHTTFIITTHVTEDVDIVDRTIILDKGRIIFDGPQKKLLGLFGNMRRMRINFRGPANARDYAPFGKIMKAEPDYIELEVPASLLVDANFIKLLAKPNIIDYYVTEQDLGNVLLRIYGGKLGGRHEKSR